jgi:glycine/D-amino acid oxidase-like deaminating enzyme
VVAYLEPPAKQQEAWKHAPMILDIDHATGCYLVPPVRGTRLKIGDHRFTRTGDPDCDREAGEADAQAIFELARPLLRDFDRYRLAGARTCFYTVESRERFLVEPLERSWLISACSGHGFKFGPVIGERIADAIEGRLQAADVTRWAAGDLED